MTRNANFARQALSLATGAGATLAKRYYSNPQVLVANAVRASHEPKNVDIYGANNLVNTNAGLTYTLNATTQGSGGTNRTGRTFQMYSLRLRYQLYTNSARTYSDQVRVTLVFDKEARGALPSVGDIYQRTTYGADLTFSPFNFDNKDRFNILYDEIHDLLPSVLLSAGVLTNDIHTFEKDINLGRRKVRCYNTSAGTIADIDEGSLFLFITGNQTAAMPGFAYSSRLIFRDL